MGGHGSPSLLADNDVSFQTGTDDYKEAQSPFDQRVEDVDIDVSQEDFHELWCCHVLMVVCWSISDQTQPSV